jgi:hypothetical protein
MRHLSDLGIGQKTIHNRQQEHSKFSTIGELMPSSLVYGREPSIPADIVPPQPVASKLLRS